MGFYEREGLNVSLQKTAGWAVVRDKVQNKEYDASHLLSPMPLAMSLGLGSAKQAVDVATIQNINGQAITLHLKHKDKLNPKDWKGMKFGLPFDYSIHNLLLRYFLAEHGLDPDKDVELRMMPPPTWWPTCVPATSTASSAPSRSTSVRYTKASPSSTPCRATCGMAIPAVPSA